MRTSSQKELLHLLRTVAIDQKLFEDLIEDLLTPQEFSEIAMRWQLIKLLDQGMPQREISKKLGISISKITRGSRELLDPKGGFQALLHQKKRFHL